MMKKRPKIEIHRARSKEYYFIVKARNGVTLVQSEMYERKASAYKGIKSLCDATWAAEDSVIDTTNG